MLRRTRSGGRSSATKTAGNRSKALEVTAASAAAVLALVGLGMVVAGGRPASGGTTTAAVQAGVIDFTTYSPPTVHRLTYSYRQGKLVLGAPQMIAPLPGADGIAYTPSGDLVVGGQGTGRLYFLPPSGGPVSEEPTGTPNAFLVALSPDGEKLYTGGLPGPLSEVPLNPPGPGHPVTLKGDDTAVTAIAFGPNGQVLYTASASDGHGDIGLLDLPTGSTHRLFSNTVGAHGAMFDPYSDSYLVIGGDSVLQLPAGNPGQIVSDFTMPGMHFDQGAVTDHGLAFFASNTGYLVTVDYSATRRIGDLHNNIQTRFVTNALDDVAPLAGPGARPEAAKASYLRLGGEASIASSVILGTALILRRGGRARPRPAGRSRKTRSRLPRWDKRRQDHPDTNWASRPIEDSDLFS
jgi:hypothetical protein